MEGTINVSTQQLRSTASELSSQGQQVSSLTSEMLNVVAGLTSSWEGTASQSYLDKFKNLDNDIQMMNRMIQEHVTDLERYAAEYEKAEQKISDLTSTLSSDVIV